MDKVLFSKSIFQEQSTYQEARRAAVSIRNKVYLKIINQGQMEKF